MQKLTEEVLDNNLASSTAVPLRDNHFEGANICLNTLQSTSNQKKQINHIPLYATHLPDNMHEGMVSLHESSKSPISVREADCLCWAASGKTASEIASILNISNHTVNFHTRNAIKKLEASNKTHAVAKAIVHGYINPHLR